MLVSITKESPKVVDISVDMHHITVSKQSAGITIQSNLGPKGPKGDGGLTQAEVETILENSPLLDGEVGGLTPLAFYNLAKGT